jgi:anti-sigma B factor antagonist
MNTNLHIDLEEIEQKIILHLDGRLDAATSAILEKKIDALIGEKKYIIYLDCLQINYLSSAGMRLLLAAAKKLKAKKGFLALFSVNEDMMDIIQLAGFEKILLIFETQQDAFQYVPK